MPKNQQNVLLSLNTLEQPRHFVEINGEHYPCQRPEDYGAIQQHRMALLVKQVQPLADRDDLNEQEVKLLSAFLNELVGDYILPTLPKEFLGAPPPVGTGLSDAHKIAIVTAFTQAVESETAAASEAPAQAKGRRSTKSTSAA